MSPGNALSVGNGNLVNWRVETSQRQMLLPLSSQNQILPSGPTVMPAAASEEENLISVIAPAGV